MKSYLGKQAKRLKRRYQKLIGTETKPVSPDGERPSVFYDSLYAATEGYHRHYSESIYYSSWTVIADRLRHRSTTSILDIGCGPGQFAAMLQDLGYTNYLGIDFSPEAIRMAKQNCPEFEFKIEDAFSTNCFEDHEYDALISLEFLEHIEDDLQIISRIPPECYFIGSVPNFPSKSHVRHFSRVDEVCDRYSSYFDEFSTYQQLIHPSGSSLFLMEGTRKSNQNDPDAAI